MWDYSEKTIELFHEPHNRGAIAAEDCGPDQAIAVGQIGSIVCGDALKLHLKIDVPGDRILDARFQTFGCASAIASSSALTDLVKGKTLDEALKLTNRDIAQFLGGLPEEKMHCSVMGQEALEAAISSYRGLPARLEMEDDGPLVCQCFGVSRPRIERIIRENGLASAEEVTHYIKAGGGCGSCLAAIDDLIAEVSAELAAAGDRLPQGTDDREATAAAVAIALEDAPAPKLTNLQKIARIQAVLEAEIRPTLAADGGNIELHDVDGDCVWVVLKGACGTCPSSLSTLKYFVEETLRDRVSPKLVVATV